MKIITHYYDDVKHDTINCVPLFPVLNLWCEFEAHLTTKSFRSRDQSVRSRCSSHSAAQSHVAYSVQCICWQSQSEFICHIDITTTKPDCVRRVGVSPISIECIFNLSTVFLCVNNPYPSIYYINISIFGHINRKKH